MEDKGTVASTEFVVFLRHTFTLHVKTKTILKAVPRSLFLFIEGIW